MKTKYQETNFNDLRVRQQAKIGGFEIDPSFIHKLSEALNHWFNQIAEDKVKQKKKPVLRYYDLKNYSQELKMILEANGN